MYSNEVLEFFYSHGTLNFTQFDFILFHSPVGSQGPMIVVVYVVFAVVVVVVVDGGGSGPTLLWINCGATVGLLAHLTRCLFTFYPLSPINFFQEKEGAPSNID